MRTAGTVRPEDRLASGTIFNISRYAIHDGPGIRTTVFFKGCPLSCWWCHNPESISPDHCLAVHPNRCIGCGQCVEACPNHAIAIVDGSAAADPLRCRLCLECARECPADAREIVGRTVTGDEVMAEIRKDIPFYDESGGGVTFSGGEPLMQPAFLLHLLDACGDQEIHRAVDTSGYAAREVLLEVAAKTDLFLYDLKHMDPIIHRNYTGVSNDVILDNLKSLEDAGAEVCIRFPVIPGVNDDRLNVERTGAFLQKLNRVHRIDILPYHDVMRSKYQRFGWTFRLGQVPPAEPSRIQEIAKQLGSFGLLITIGGDSYERSYSQAPASQP
jgi:pyruvate formate lyase activating enzyme